MRIFHARTLRYILIFHRHGKRNIRFDLPPQAPLLNEAPVCLEPGVVPRQGPIIHDLALILLDPEHVLPAGANVHHDFVRDLGPLHLLLLLCKARSLPLVSIPIATPSVLHL